MVSSKNLFTSCSKGEGQSTELAAKRRPAASFEKVGPAADGEELVAATL